MGRRAILLVLGLAALGLAGCEPYPGPTANCFSLLASEAPCEFRPVAGEPDGDA